VEQTFTSGAEGSFSRGGADFFGNNFGLHDLVAYNPGHQTPEDLRFKGRIKGVVLDIHQYNPDISFGRYGFLVRAYFDRVGKIDFFASQMEALTCSGLKLDKKVIARFQEVLKDVPVFYDPFQNEEGEAFSDPVARALLISYKQNHLVAEGDPPKINKLFCDIASRLKDREIPRERIHLWLKKQLGATRFTMGDEQIAALIPFLVGERVANYHIEPRDAVSPA
jgi:hypothetical protein